MEGVHLFGSFEVVVRLRLNLLLYSHIYCFQPASKNQSNKEFHLQEVGEKYQKWFIQTKQEIKRENIMKENLD